MVTQNYKSNRPHDGTLLEGKFRVTREIGRGGMAAVYEAENIDIGKRVAVKILAAELITSRIVRERFLREARAAAAARTQSLHLRRVRFGHVRGAAVPRDGAARGREPVRHADARAAVGFRDDAAHRDAFGARPGQGARVEHRAPRPQARKTSSSPKTKKAGLPRQAGRLSACAKFYEPTNDGGPTKSARA